MQVSLINKTQIKESKILDRVSKLIEPEEPIKKGFCKNYQYKDLIIEVRKIDTTLYITADYSILDNSRRRNN